MYTKKQQKIEGTHVDENISDINKWLHVITFTNISNAAEVLVKFENRSYNHKPLQYVSYFQIDLAWKKAM